MVQLMALGFVLASFAITAYTQSAPAPANKAEIPSCGPFVQDFYDWYTPIGTVHKNRLTVSLRPRKSSFDPKLWQMLVDYDTTRSAAGETVGLDFDPIVGSQELISNHKIMMVAQFSRQCMVGIDVADHVAAQGGIGNVPLFAILWFSDADRWVISNFQYRFHKENGKLVDTDLVQILTDLKKSRDKQSGSSK